MNWIGEVEGEVVLGASLIEDIVDEHAEEDVE